MSFRWRSVVFLFVLATKVSERLYRRGEDVVGMNTGELVNDIFQVFHENLR